MNSPTFKLKISNGLDVCGIEYGDPDGLPVIALHGWLDNAASFYEFHKHLRGIRLISIDLIGHGLSSRRPKGMPYHIWDNVTDLEAILSALEIDKAHLIGHSMGASIGMLFAGAFPDRVTNLMCIEGLVPLSYDVDNLPALFAEAVIKRNKMASKTLKPYKSREDAVLARINGRWPVNRKAAEELLKRGLKQTPEGYEWSHDPNLMLPSLVRFSPEQIRSFLKAVKATTWVVKGSKGAAYLIDGWVQELEQFELITMKGGHHLHLETPVAQELANIINNWT